MRSDLTARARIRDAALERFGTEGVARATIRAIAADADVSPALVLHHFGSRDGLRAACDAYVIETIRGSAGRESQLSDVGRLAANLQGATGLRRYLARTLIDGTAGANTLFDEIVEVTAAELATGESAGWAQPSSDPRARAAVYVSWLLAPLVFGDHLARAFGVDDLHSPDATVRYSHAMVEMLTRGVFTDDDALQAWDALTGTATSDPPAPDDDRSPTWPPPSARTTPPAGVEKGP
ncbi:TetR family transcriptional regulator [Brachybacterium sp. GCM10030267]|uniref:TetR family transcriptional regulator n=1 Tax=unclassified Brachybacterium TaxID=2623841 RepID=UPI00362146BC